MHNTKPRTAAEMEELIYGRLMRDIPDLQPLVARGLAKTAAERFAKFRVADRTALRVQSSDTKQPMTNHENDAK